MSTYSQASLDLGATQQEVVEAVLAEMRRQGLIKSDAELETERQRLLSSLRSGEPALKLRKQGGVTRSEPFNESMREASLDLQTLFAHLLKIDGALNRHQRLNQAVLQAIRLAVARLRDQLDRAEDRLERGSGTYSVFEGFRDPGSFETDAALYRIRATDPEPVPPANQAILDLDQEGIKLPLVRTENALISPTGLQLGRISIVRQLGGGLMRTRNPSTGLDKAIDTSPETFWSETILADEPIRVRAVPSEYYCGIEHGALCELQIRFDALTVINELSFTPFAEYPVEIVAVRAFTQDIEDPGRSGAGVDLVAPALALRGRGSLMTLDPVVYQLPETPVKQLNIILNQIHYTRADLLVSSKENRKVELMLGAGPDGSAEPTVPEGTVFAPVVASRYEQEPFLARVAQALAGQAEPDLEQLIAAQDEETVIPMSKFAYSYGMHDIGVKRREYADLGVYVSRPVGVGGDAVKGVALSVTEQHRFREGTPDVAMTSIEYEVSPNGADWFPILPQGQEQVLGELLPPFSEAQVGPDAREYYAFPRFPWVRILRVQRNGTPVTSGVRPYEDRLAVTLQEYDPGSVYTVDYEPRPQAAVVSLEHLPDQESEPQQKGTDRHGRITLPVATTDMAQVEVTVTDAQSNLIRAINTAAPGAPDFSTADGAPLQFRFSGPRQIQFNRRLSREETITVTRYHYLAKEIRLKAILRRTLPDEPGATPVLKGYTLHLIS